MLQQTTVVAVVPYFERFLAAFPTLEMLAAADEEDVLRLWEGLGYYSRARNIHKAARQIVAEHNGEFPNDVETLQSLPGIGRYTAGAIASFAFDRRAPIVEANTLRLHCRLLGYRGDPRSSSGQRLLWEFAENVLPRRSPGEMNQALMELGATVCTPANPDCEHCPVKRNCATFAQGLQSKIPRVVKRAEPTVVTEVAVAVVREGKFLLQKRLPGERWAGLWDFVRFAAEKESGKVRMTKPRRTLLASSRDLIQKVRAQTELDVALSEHVVELRHTVTRFRITLHCYMADWVAGDTTDAPRESRWFSLHELSALPLSMTGRKLARILASRTLS